MFQIASEECITPLISVIIPVYNVAPYLREALDSVVNQTYKDLEIIIVDDGSTDESGTICDEYKGDARVTVIRQAHHGPGKARNIGLDIATGDYIAFLDSDDAYHPGFIYLMLSAIGEADIVECQYEVHQMTLKSIGQIPLTKKDGCYDRIRALQDLVERRSFTGVWNKLYRKELWRNVRFPEGHLYEDVETLFRVFDLCNQYVYIDQVLYHYRRRPGSTTQTFSCNNILDYKLAHEWEIKFVEANIPEIFNEAHLRKARQNLAIHLMIGYGNGVVDTKEIKTVCESADTKGLNIRTKIAFQMIRHCPWLYKNSYLVYRILKMYVCKILGRQAVEG